MKKLVSLSLLLVIVCGAGVCYTSQVDKEELKGNQYEKYPLHEKQMFGFHAPELRYQGRSSFDYLDEEEDCPVKNTPPSSPRKK